MPRTSTTIAAVAGLAAIAAAGTLRLAIVPAQAQLPADTDSARQYAGTVHTILDAEALAAGDLGNAIIRDVPVTLNRTSTVTGVDGSTATVFETGNVVAPDGTTLAGYESAFSVDRKTMQGLDDRSGLVMGWPIGTEARDYRGWSGDLQSEVDLTFTGEADFQGIDAYVYTSSVQGQIVDEATLAQFPSSLPKFVLPMVAEALAIDAAVAEQLPALLSVLPDEVPLAYLIDSETTYWVDPATGMVLDLDRTESRQVAFDVEGVPMFGLADVYAISYMGTTDSVAATVAESKSNAASLYAFGVVVPIGLIVLGLGLLGFAAFRRRSGVVTTDRDGVEALGEVVEASTKRELADA